MCNLALFNLVVIQFFEYLSVHFWPLKIEAYLHKNLVCTNCYESIHCTYLSLSRVNKIQCRTFEAFLVLYSFEHLD